MKNTKRILVAALFLLTTTLFIQAQSAKKSHDPVKKATKHTERMVKELSLTDDQARQVGALNLEFAKKRQALRKEEGDRSQKKPAMKELRSELAKEMKGILTTEQFSKWNTVKADRKGRRGHGKHGRKMDKATKAYHKANVEPVLLRQRTKLESKISAADKAKLVVLRKKMKAKRAEMKKNREGKMDKGTREDRKAAREAFRNSEERKQLEGLVDKYQTEIDALMVEIQPQAEVWEKEMRELREAKRAEKRKEGKGKEGKKGKKKDRSHDEETRPHGKGKHKAERFLLMDPTVQ